MESRVIKFRAWCSNKNQMIYHDINYFTSSDILGSYPETVMQYTGLKDKNGKEIYEGDVVQVYYSDGEYESRTIHRVTWGNSITKNDYPAFTLDWGKHDEGINALQLAIIEHHIEVIGNIYQHEHLLNG